MYKFSIFLYRPCPVKDVIKFGKKKLTNHLIFITRRFFFTRRANNFSIFSQTQVYLLVKK